MARILLKIAVEKLTLEVLIALLCRKPIIAPSFNDEVKKRFKKKGNDTDSDTKDKKKDFDRYPKEDPPLISITPTWIIPIIGVLAALRWLGQGVTTLSRGGRIAQISSWRVRCTSMGGWHRSGRLYWIYLDRPLFSDSRGRQVVVYFNCQGSAAEIWCWRSAAITTITTVTTSQPQQPQSPQATD